MDFHPTEDAHGEAPGGEPHADASASSVRTPLSYLAALAGDATKIGGGIAAALVFCFAIWFIASQATTKLLIVDPVEIPDTLQKAGVTADGVTRQLTHDMQYVQAVARYIPSKNDPSGATERNATPAKDVPDIALPEAKVSLQSFSHAIRGFLDISTDHVSLAIRPVEAAGARNRRYRLSMAISEDSVRSWTFRLDSLDATLQAAADTVVGHFDPTILAIYALQRSRDTRDTDQARGLAYRALGGARRDGDALAYWVIGAVASARHYDNEAVTQLRLALTHNPKFAQAYLWWGLTADHAGRLTEAKQMFDSAARYDRTNGWALADAGNVLWRSTRDPDARALYVRAIRADPTVDLSYLGLGDLAFYRLHHMADARQWYSEALARSDGFANWNAMGDLESLQNNLIDADSDYAHALANDSNNADAQLNLVAINLTRGRYDDAECDLRAARGDVDLALRSDSANINGYYDLAQIYQLAQLPDSADRILRLAMQISPEDAGLYIQGGDLWSDHGDTVLVHDGVDAARPWYHKADELYNSATQHAPTSVDAALGYAYDREKTQDTAATDAYKAVLQLDDRASIALDGLAAERLPAVVAQWSAHFDSVESCFPSQGTNADACRELNLAEAINVARAVDSVGNFYEAASRFSHILDVGSPNGRVEALLGRDLNRLGDSSASWHFRRADSLGYREQWMYDSWAGAAQKAYGSDSARAVRRLGAQRLRSEQDRRRRFLDAALHPPGEPLKGYVHATSHGCASYKAKRTLTVR